MKNSFPPTWQDARMMGCKIVPLKCVFEPTSDFEVTQLPVTNLPILLGVMFFFNGVLKFNTLSK